MATFNAFTNGSSSASAEVSALDLGGKAHAHWLTLDDDSTMKLDWCVGYVVGMFRVSEKLAREWADLTRSERTAIVVKHIKGEGTAEKCWNTATAQWNYRVVKDSNRAATVNSTKEEVKLTKAQRAAIKACMELGITMKLFGQGVALLK